MSRGVRHSERWLQKAAAAEEPVQVVDDLPDIVPIAGDELDAIESYLGAALTELLAAREGGAESENPIMPDPREKRGQGLFSEAPGRSTMPPVIR